MVIKMSSDNFPKPENIAVLTSIPDCLFVRQQDGTYRKYRVKDFVGRLIRGEKVD